MRHIIPFYFSKVVHIFLLFFLSSFFIPTCSAATTTVVLGVTQITAVQTFATADGTYDNGWKWIFDVTAPTHETAVQMKFANWADHSNAIPAGGNMRFYSAQSTDAFDASHAIDIVSAGVYSGIMNIDSSTDLDVTRGGRQFQIMVEVRVPSGSTSGSYSTSYGITSSLGDEEIEPGSVMVTKDSGSPSGDIVAHMSDVVLAKYAFAASNETIKIESLKAGFSTSGSATDLQNGRILIDGIQFGSTTALAASGTTYTGVFYVEPGTPVVVEVRADIESSAGTLSSGNTILTSLLDATGNGMGIASSTTVDIPSMDKSANTLIVRTANVSLAENVSYTDKTVVLPKTAFKLADYTLLNSGYEDVNLDMIMVTFAETTGTTFNEDDLTNVYVMYGDQTTNIKSTVSASNAYSISHTLASTDGIAVAVYADIGSTVTSTHSITTTVTISGTTALSGTTATTGAVAGQTMAAGAGTFAEAVDASRPDSVLVADATTGIKVGSYKFTTTNDNYSIWEVDADFGTAAQSVIQYAKIADASTGTVLSTVPLQSGNAAFSLDVPVAANSSVILDVYVDLGTIGYGAGTSGADLQANVNYVMYVNSEGTVGEDSSLTYAGQSMYAFKAYPTITNSTLPTTVLATGTATLAKHTISSTGGTAGFKKIVYTVSKSANPTITAATVKLYKDGVEVPSATPTVTAGLTAAGAASGTITIIPTNEVEISSSSVFELKATIGGSATTGDSIYSYIADGASSQTAPAAYATVAATGATLVWTDQSASSHTALTTDWNDDYLVNSIATDAQTLSR